MDKLHLSAGPYTHLLDYQAYGQFHYYFANEKKFDITITVVAINSNYVRKNFKRPSLEETASFHIDIF